MLFANVSLVVGLTGNFGSVISETIRKDGFGVWLASEIFRVFVGLFMIYTSFFIEPFAKSSRTNFAKLN